MSPLLLRIFAFCVTGRDLLYPFSLVKSPSPLVIWVISLLFVGVSHIHIVLGLKLWSLMFQSFYQSLMAIVRVPFPDTPKNHIKLTVYPILIHIVPLLYTILISPSNSIKHH